MATGTATTITPAASSEPECLRNICSESSEQAHDMSHVISKTQCSESANKVEASVVGHCCYYWQSCVIIGIAVLGSTTVFVQKVPN